jgi:hypothetical protein
MNEQPYGEDLGRLQVSIQRALLGEVTDALYAVTLGKQDGILSIHAYYDGQPSEEDEERMQVVATEVLADFRDGEVRELEVRFFDRHIDEPTRLGLWGFRKADDLRPHRAK